MHPLHMHDIFPKPAQPKQAAEAQVFILLARTTGRRAPKQTVHNFLPVPLHIGQSDRAPLPPQVGHQLDREP